MESLEVNKAIASVLVAGVAFMLSTLIADNLVHPTALKQPAIKVETPQGAAPAGGAPAEQPIGPMIAAADPAKGEALAKKYCAACHTFDEGGKAGVGPNLYGVVGAPHGHMAGFDYSSALKSKQGPWTYDELNEWLTKPQAYAPGTKMGFAGDPKEEERAEIIAYLRTLSHNPEPLPAAAPAKAAAAEAHANAPGANAPGEQKGGPSIAAQLASADPAEGQKLAAKYCGVCHTFNDGGKAGVGPNLYGVVGAPHGHMAGYEYSSALKSKPGPWTFDELNEWLTKPQAYAPGTKMGFAGLPSAKERADIIDYLRTLSPHPEPLPAAQTEKAPAVQSGNPQAGNAGAQAPSQQQTPTEQGAGSQEPPKPQGGAPSPSQKGGAASE